MFLSEVINHRTFFCRLSEWRRIFRKTPGNWSRCHAPSLFCLFSRARLNQDPWDESFGGERGLGGWGCVCVCGGRGGGGREVGGGQEEGEGVGPTRVRRRQARQTIHSQKALMVLLPSYNQELVTLPGDCMPKIWLKFWRKIRSGAWRSYSRQFGSWYTTVSMTQALVLFRINLIQDFHSFWIDIHIRHTDIAWIAKQNMFARQRDKGTPSLGTFNY